MSRKIAFVQPAEPRMPAAAQEENSLPPGTLRFPTPSRHQPSARASDAPEPPLSPQDLPVAAVASLWELDIAEVTGHNLEARGREEVNRMLGEGWRLLHIYTLRYREDGVWRERPMAILGRPRVREERAEGSEAAARKGGPHENPAGRG